MPCNTMQYHASLITADGAYHCPVGSIMAIFKYRVLFFQPLVMFVSTKKVLWKFKLWQKRHFCANNCNTRRLCKSRCAEYCQLLVQKCLFCHLNFHMQLFRSLFQAIRTETRCSTCLSSREVRLASTQVGALLKSKALQAGELSVCWLGEFLDLSLTNIAPLIS